MDDVGGMTGSGCIWGDGAIDTHDGVSVSVVGREGE